LTGEGQAGVERVLTDKWPEGMGIQIIGSIFMKGGRK
jgi:hypothetical protein